jgi:hypothetical protein
VFEARTHAATWGSVTMPIDIKLSVTITLEETALEDALAEYDEMRVGAMVQQVLDKAIALEQVHVEVVEGPNSLEEYDRYREQA